MKDSEVLYELLGSAALLDRSIADLRDAGVEGDFYHEYRRMVGDAMGALYEVTYRVPELRSLEEEVVEALQSKAREELVRSAREAVHESMLRLMDLRDRLGPLDGEVPREACESIADGLDIAREISRRLHEYAAGQQSG